MGWGGVGWGVVRCSAQGYKGQGPRSQSWPGARCRGLGFPGLGLDAMAVIVRLEPRQIQLGCQGQASP